MSEIQMKPGPELNGSVAVAMGWETNGYLFWRSMPPHNTVPAVLLPKYSTDIGVCWKLIEELAAKNIRLELLPISENRYMAGFLRYVREDPMWCWHSAGTQEVGESAQHAICLSIIRLMSKSQKVTNNSLREPKQ